ncbi:MAG: hypothetical protein ACOX1Q_01445 [Eubacteriales bacterium]|jgi:hypothetical protein
MTNDYEALAKALLQSPQGVAVLKNLDKIQDLANNPESQRLLAGISGKSGDALKSAAAAATKGDQDMAKRLLSSLLSTPEGTQLAKAVLEMMQK